MIQLVFSAGIVPVAGTPGLEQIAIVSPARWGFAAAASNADFNTIIRAGKQRPKTEANPHPTSVVDQSVPIKKLGPDGQQLIDPKTGKPEFELIPVNPRAPVPDPLFKHGTKTYVIDVAGGTADAVVYIGIVSLLLRRLDPKTKQKRKAATA
jgi:hypothetical protein